MMKKIFTPKFIKYLIAGISTVLLDIISLVALKKMFFFSATLAVATNQIIVWFYNFSINKHLVFQNKALPYKQFLRYLILAGSNYLLAIAVMYIFSDILGIYYLTVRLATIACMTIWNYIIYKYWVYV